MAGGRIHADRDSIALDIALGFLFFVRGATNVRMCVLSDAIFLALTLRISFLAAANKSARKREQSRVLRGQPNEQRHLLHATRSGAALACS